MPKHTAKSVSTSYIKFLQIITTYFQYSQEQGEIFYPSKTTTCHYGSK